MIKNKKKEFTAEKDLYSEALKKDQNKFYTNFNESLNEIKILIKETAIKQEAKLNELETKIENKIIKLEERIKYLEERVELNKIVVKNLPCALMELFHICNRGNAISNQEIKSFTEMVSKLGFGDKGDWVKRKMHR